MYAFPDRSHLPEQSHPDDPEEPDPFGHEAGCGGRLCAADELELLQALDPPDFEARLDFEAREERREEREEEERAEAEEAGDKTAAPQTAPDACGIAEGGSPLVVVANRLPVRQARRGGQTLWERSPGGLVSALDPVLRRRPGTWVGWPGVHGATTVPLPGKGPDADYAMVPVAMSQAEHRDYYENFSNRTLWPLYHGCIRPPTYSSAWWATYERVNQRFASCSAAHVEDQGTVWVHDYQLQLVPGYLRGLRPDLRIGFFLHIPFPPPELFDQLPWRSQVARGLVAADLIGCQSEQDAANLRAALARFGGGRRSRVASFPISIDFAHHDRLAADPAVQRRARRIRSQLGGQRKLILGIDRLDYTKGIEHRLRAFQHLLTTGAVDTEQCALVLVSVPSREHVREYRELRSEIEELVGQINGRFGQVGRSAVHYLRRSVPPTELAALYAAADVMLVTPLRDGMNLVAKEYVASRRDETGVLVLSEFAGAAAEMPQALWINPNDLEGTAAQIRRALAMPRQEQRQRMAAMRAHLRLCDVRSWAGRFLAELAAAAETPPRAAAGSHADLAAGP